MRDVGTGTGQFDLGRATKENPMHHRTADGTAYYARTLPQLRLALVAKALQLLAAAIRP